jgi:hypothetical protein
MKKGRVFIGSSVILLVLCAGGYYAAQWAKCFAGGGGTALVPPGEAKRNHAIVVKFEMSRWAGMGCLAGNTSDSFTSVACGYRLSGEEVWNSVNVKTESDSERLYTVSCQIPSSATLGSRSPKIEYYFDFTYAGHRDRRLGSLVVR